MSCRRSQAFVSGGAGTYCTARIATGGRSATSPSASWAPVPGSVPHALLVRQWSDDVVFFVHTLELSSGELRQLQARGVQVVSGVVARLVVKADRLTGVELSNGRLIPRRAVFVRPVNQPHADGLLTGLGCDVDEAGFVIVDATGRTSTFGVWAAGNVVDPRSN